MHTFYSTVDDIGQSPHAHHTPYALILNIVCCVTLCLCAKHILTRCRSFLPVIWFVFSSCFSRNVLTTRSLTCRNAHALPSLARDSFVQVWKRSASHAERAVRQQYFLSHSRRAFIGLRRRARQCHILHSTSWIRAVVTAAVRGGDSRVHSRGYWRWNRTPV